MIQGTRTATRASASTTVAYTAVSSVMLPGPEQRQAAKLYYRMVPGVGAAPAITDAMKVAQQTRGPKGPATSGLEIPVGYDVSFGTYFNAFPASYYQRWTDCAQVRLRVEVSGTCEVTVYRSNSRGDIVHVDSTITKNEARFTLPLNSFGDGGWYWFAVSAEEAGARFLSADWGVPTDSLKRDGGSTVAITTFNRPRYCIRQLQRLVTARQAGHLGAIKAVIVVDQGTQKVLDEPEFDEISTQLGDFLKYIQQANLGGAGGFSRGMHEAQVSDVGANVILLDDDIELEPECLQRLDAFSRATRTPTIVGGHMFNMGDRTRLHSFGERVNRYTFWWGPVEPELTNIDLAVANFENTPALHRRLDVDFNGWWMSCIPLTAVRQLGYALPVFIKWDDAEYSLRAKRAGYPTVTLPGAAVWHVPWMDKDDSLDWQSFYHQRNRWLAALLHSEYPRAGRLPVASLSADVKHLMSMQYAVVEQRCKALEVILDGPDHLHRELPTRMPSIRQEMGRHQDGVKHKGFHDLPSVEPLKPFSSGSAPRYPQSIPGRALRAASGLARQSLGSVDHRPGVVELSVSAANARWWLLSQLASAAVTGADGAGFTTYARQPREFRRLFARSLSLHTQLLMGWSDLSRAYQAAAPSVVSAQAWAQHFEDAH